MNAQQSTLTVVQIIAGFAVEKLGGIERFGIELARAINGRGVVQGEREIILRPIVCAIWDWGTAEEDVWRARLDAEGIPTVTAAPKDDDAPYRNYLDVLRGMRDGISGPVDILHSHSEFGDVAAIRLRRALDAQALVRTVHNEREWPKRPLRRLLLTNGFLPLVFDLEMGVSQQVVENLNRRPLARLLGRRARVMYNALNFDRFRTHNTDRAAKRAELEISPDAPVIGSVGRLSEQKGYGVLLQAVPLVLARRPDARFLIAGEGYLRGALEEQARQLGVAHAVRFLGRRTDVEDLLQIFDLFVSSSLWEGLPTVILEALASGVPVVATRVSGNVELVQDGVTGLLAPPDDPPALAQAMLQALDQRGALQAAIDRSGQATLRKFSMDEIARAHMDLYTDLMGWGAVDGAG